MKRKIVFLALVIIALATTATVFANTQNRQVTATMNYEITIRLDGEVLTLRDAGGNVVQPLSFEGTTYLPLRALAEILGLDVEWDGSTQTVSLYAHAAREAWLADHATVLNMPGGVGNNRLHIVRGTSTIPQPANDPGINTSALGLLNLTSMNASGVLELDRVYTSITFDSAFMQTNITPDTRVYFINDDTNTVLHQMDIPPNSFTEGFSFNLHGATRIRVEAPMAAPRGGGGSDLFFINPIVQ